MNRPIRVLELRSVRGTGGGPEKTILMGAARSDPRFAITVCYLRDARDPVFSIDAKAARLPIDYVELRERHSFDVDIWRQLRRLLQERAIDIVHAHEYKSDLLAWMAGHSTGVIPLSTVHGWTGHSFREKWFYYPADKRLLARFPRLIAVSTDVRDELVRHGARPERVTTVLNGIDHRACRRDRGKESAVRERLRLPQNAFVIGAVGRLEPQKRFDRLISVVKQLCHQSNDVRLLIVGDGSQRAALRSQIQEARLESVCVLLGQRADVVDLHHAFDVFVQSSDYEGTSNAVLEAMALETPIVATDAGGTEDIVRGDIDGIIVRIGDQDGLRVALERVMVDRGGARTRAAAARRRVETDLSFDARMAAVETIYSDLFEERRDLKSGAAMAARA